MRDLAQEHHLTKDWLNDAVKGFVVDHNRQVWFNWSHLKVYVPEPDYLLAMKALASRVDTKDKKDLQFLIKKMEITQAEKVFQILEDYYPRKHIKPVTQFFIEELFEK